MRIKHILITAVLATAILSFGPSINAQTTDTQALIAQLQAQIAQLLAQIQALQAQQGATPAAWCHNFNTNLRFGDKGCPNNEAGGGYAGCNYEGRSDKLEALWKALEKEGFGSSLTEDKFNGEFGEGTASAVVEFQEKYASDILVPLKLKHGTGNFGPTTRKKMNALYGCATSTQPSITVTSPNGGETYKPGDSITVNWKTTNVSSSQIFDVIRLRAYPNGQEYGLVYKTSNDGQQVVPIPSSVPVGAYTLEIKTYVNNVLVFDASDSYFKIVSTIIATCSDSDGGTVVDVYGSTYFKLGSFELKHPDECVIALSYDNNGNPVGSQSTGSCSGKNCYIEEAYCRIDENGNFIDADATELINCPNGCENGACKQATTKQSITLSPSSGPIGTLVTVTGTGFSRSNNTVIFGDYRLNGIASSSGTTLTFYVPSFSLIPSTGVNTTPTVFSGMQYSVVVTNEGGSSQVAWFAVTAATTQPSITVTSPNGGEQWKVGETHRVTWSSSGVNNVRIYIFDDSIYGSGSTNYITPNNNYILSSQGYYDWTIQQNQLPGSSTLPRDYKIRVDDMDNGDNVTLRDSSDNYFSITAATTQPSITVTFTASDSNGQTFPTNTITIPVGSTVNFAYSATNATNCYAYINSTLMNSTDIGLTQGTTSGHWETLARTSGFTATYTVTCSNASGQQASKSITLNLTSAPTQPSITVTSPNGGETWTAGTTHNITWNSVGIDRVVINTYFNDSPLYGSPVVSASSGSYSWAIDSGFSAGRYKIEISQYTSGNAVSDISDNYFSITAAPTQPSITVTSPNGGETWKIGETKNITWNSSNMGTGKVFIQLENGSSPYSLAFNIPASQGSYPWTIASSGNFVLPGSSYKIRVGGNSSATNVYYNDASDNVFSIIAPIYTCGCSDVNGDGWIAPTDSLTLVNLINSTLTKTNRCAGGAVYDVKKDVNGDGCIDETDYQCVLTDINTNGARQATCNATSFINRENQLTSISAAISRIIQGIQEMLKK